jgi:hypothetical protein
MLLQTVQDLIADGGHRPLRRGPSPHGTRSIDFGTTSGSTPWSSSLTVTDTASSSSLDSLLGRLRERGHGEGRQVRIFTIAYGDDANGDVLEQIAAASWG